MSPEINVPQIKLGVAKALEQNHGVDMSRQGLDKFVPPGCVHHTLEELDRLALLYAMRQVEIQVEGETRTIIVADLSKPLNQRMRDDCTEQSRPVIDGDRHYTPRDFGVRFVQRTNAASA